MSSAWRGTQHCDKRSSTTKHCSHEDIPILESVGIYNYFNGVCLFRHVSLSARSVYFFLSSKSRCSLVDVESIFPLARYCVAIHLRVGYTLADS